MNRCVMEKYESVITVVFQFVGKVPAPFSTSSLFAENLLKGEKLWNDPGTAGNLMLQKFWQSRAQPITTMVKFILALRS